jgi:hypothetical protein
MKDQQMKLAESYKLFIMMKGRLATAMQSLPALDEDK